MKKFVVCVSMLMVLGMSSLALASIIKPEKAWVNDGEKYVIQHGDIFDVKIYIDMDESDRDYQVPGAGIFSVGIKMKYDKSLVKALSVELPDMLKDDGTGGAPKIEFGDGFIGCAAAVGMSAYEGYKSPWLVTFKMQDLTDSNGLWPYEMSLGLYFDDPKANFMDFDGNVIDNQITFGTALVPEPGSVLLILGSISIMWKKKIHK